MNERLNRFTILLKQIFELDKSDLDFGIYLGTGMFAIFVAHHILNTAW